ncbi:uncharacterized protein LOC130728224 [Lotus japonicus]|uniref:uncharacterized protein LOC130728224 n=1 Tax=Lotus japonicus TaxID=34305 RepID=UPI00258E029C|nr:uncharacterized protein LOC130728224 [Lotus japonicus]
MDEEEEIIEVREEYMVSPSSNENPTQRIAYFLKPCSQNCIQESPHPHDFLHSFLSNQINAITEVRYNGWQKPQEEWKIWVQKMQLKYEHLWVKAGINHAIQASTYEFNRKHELILALAQRWCSKTNTFIFPWGEATVTLEDLKVCWGYSVMGVPVSSPLETSEQKEVEAEQIEARRMFNSTKSKKVTHRPWVMHFMKNESRVEHEAFLIYWLSRFVFPKVHETILKSVFPIAIHLARGTRVALAPAVLASIYRDLSLLNNTINNIGTTITLWAPFQVVQIWAMERFPALQRYPQAVEEQVLWRWAKWDGVKMVKDKNLKSVLDSAGDCNRFLWRPYNNSPSLKLYNEKEMWECDNPNLDYELESFGRCLRACKLVGMGCVEQYLPHRVALQFGLDQDIPGMVLDCNNDPWICYSQPIMYMNLESALFSCQSNVTSRYYDWWRQSKSGNEGEIMKCFDLCPISISSSEHLSPISNGQVKSEGSFGPPPGFTSKFGRDQAGDFDKNDQLGERRDKDDSEEAKMKSPFCDINGAIDMEGEGEGARVGLGAKVVAELKDAKLRISKLEKVVAELKAAKFGPKVERGADKAKP